MKKISIILVLATTFAFTGRAQIMEQGMLPPSIAKEKEYTEWKKVEGTLNGEKLTFEYQIAFVKRKALACYYDVHVKNTSGKPLKMRVKTHYFDKLVKSRFGDEFKETLKADKDISFIVITQGAKADKEKKDQPDIERCLSCDLSYEIYAEFK